MEKRPGFKRGLATGCHELSLPGWDPLFFPRFTVLEKFPLMKNRSERLTDVPQIFNSIKGQGIETFDDLDRSFQRFSPGDHEKDLNRTGFTQSFHRRHGVSLVSQVSLQFGGFPPGDNPDEDIPEGDVVFDGDADVITRCKTCSIGYVVGPVIKVGHDLADDQEPDQDFNESRHR